ncbi:MAG: hypothetical protein HQK54_08405 [Oligoflexales bacterium]|nr:hypothetical protein [Oligoflexales bacterium]
MRKKALRQTCVLLGCMFLFLMMHGRALRVNPLIDDYCLFDFGKNSDDRERPMYDRFYFDLVTDDARINKLTSWRLWWGDPELKMKFFRPLSSFLHSFDEKYIGRTPYIFRLHSMFWGFLYIILSGGLLYRFTGQKKGALSLLIITLSPVLLLYIMWIATRSHLITAVFSLLSFFFYLSWRKDGRKAGYPLMLLALILSLGSSEMGYLGFILIFFYELIFFGKGERKSIWMFSPMFIIVMAYVLLYIAGGYGVRNSAFYIFILDDPLIYLKTFLARYPVLLAGQIALFLQRPFEESYPNSYYVFSFIIIILFCFGIYSTIKNAESKRKKIVLWFAAVNLASLVPLVSVPPNNRVYIVSMFSIVPLSIYQIEFYLKSWKKQAIKKRIVNFLWCGYLSLSFFVLGPAVNFATQRFVIEHAEFLEKVMNRSDFIETRDLDNEYFVVNAGSLIFNNAYMQFTYNYYHPDKWIPFWNILTISENPLKLTVIDSNTLEIEFLKGDLLDFRRSGLSRRKEKTFQPGDVFLYWSMVIKVIDVKDGHPIRIRYNFLDRLDSPRYHFIIWNRDRFAKVTLPKAGESVIFEAAGLPDSLL